MKGRLGETLWFVAFGAAGLFATQPPVWCARHSETGRALGSGRVSGGMATLAWPWAQSPSNHAHASVGMPPVGFQPVNDRFQSSATPRGDQARARQSQDAAAPRRPPGPDEGDTARCLQLMQMGRFDAARAMAARWVKQYPASSRAHLLLALTFHKQRRYETAEPLFQRAVALDPTDHVVRMFYGWCLYNLGKSEEARKMFEAYLKEDPTHADAHFALGLLDFDADDLDSAERRFDRAIELASREGNRIDEAKARARRADVYVRKGNLQDGRRELERAVKLNPDLYGAYFKLSRVLQRLGDREGAAEARRMHDRVRDRVHPEKGHPE